MKVWFRHISVAVAALTTTGALFATQADQSGAAAFTVFLRGQSIGTEEVTVTRSPGGWAIAATGRTGAPLNMSFDKFVARYGAEWQTQSLEIAGQLRGQGSLRSGRVNLASRTSASTEVSGATHANCWPAARLFPALA